MRRHLTAITLIALAGTTTIRQSRAEEVRAADAPASNAEHRRALGERALELQRQWLNDRHNEALREETRVALREAIRAGGMSPFKAAFTDVVEEIYGAPESTELNDPIAAGSLDRQLERVRASNPHPWSEQIILGEDFEYAEYTPHVSLSSLADLRPLRGQRAQNGNIWKTATTRVYNGLVTNATAQTGVDAPGGMPGSGYLGVAGGPDSLGVQGRFLASPRGSVLPLTSTAFNTSFEWVARLDHTFFIPVEDQPVVTTVDWYMDSLETFTWFRPVTSPEGCIVTNLFMGGIDYFTFAPFTNDDHILDRAIILGAKPGSMDEGEFFAAANHRIKAREWYQVALRQGADTFSAWIRDSETRGANPSGLPYDAPGYEGEIFDTEWVQFFPGFDDDPNTLVIEGSGLAENTWGQKADQITGADGNVAGAILFGFGIEELQVVGGFDMPKTLEPDYRPTDWYVDNYAIIGRPYQFSQVQPPVTLPYVDDMELWQLGPVAVQDDRWFDAMSHSEIVASQNHTSGIGLDGEPASQAMMLPNVYQHNAYVHMVDLELFDEGLAARATVVTDIVFRSWFRLADHKSTYGVALLGNREPLCRLFFGARDGANNVDDRLYLQLANPAYDPGLPEPDMVTPNVLWNGSDNRALVPAPMRIAGGDSPASLPLESWFEVEVRIDLRAGETRGDVRVLLDGEPLEIDADALAALGAPALSADAIAGVWLDEINIECGYEAGGATSRLWWDDIFIDGAAEQRPTPLTIDHPPYATQPPFELPYFDGFETYLTEVSMDRQGATPYLGLPYSGDNRRVDVIPQVAPLVPGAPVYLYTVQDIAEFAGPLPPGLAIGQTVAVEANYPEFRNPYDSPVPGNPGGTSVARFYTNNLGPVAQILWRLSSSVPSGWDGATPVVGRYLFEYETRWRGDPTEPFAVDIDGEHPGHGAALAITQDFVSGNADAGFLNDVMTSTLPEPNLLPGERSRLAFDLFIESPDMRPLARTAIDVRGATYDELLITQIVFGGPNIYVDLNNDGFADDDHPSKAADPAKFYVLRPNLVHPNNPGLLVAEAFEPPVNEWLRVVIEVARNGAWTLSLQSQARAELFTTSGVPVVSSAAEPEHVAGTAGLDIRFGNDDGGAGRAPFEPVVWASLGAGATPEGGLDPHDDQYNPMPATYLYYEILDIDEVETPNLSALPDVTEVDLVTGGVLGVRDLEVNDVVVLFNDTGAGSGVPSGVPVTDVHPRNPRWQFSEDGVTVVGAGQWRALGLPGDDGLNDPVPPGGITALAPPYTPVVPFRTLLMGRIVDLPPYPEARPPHRVLIDNLALEVVGCAMDLTGDNAVDASDLSILLAGWASGTWGIDANRDTFIDGQDLAALLARWGVCEGGAP